MKKVILIILLVVAIGIGAAIYFLGLKKETNINTNATINTNTQINTNNNLNKNNNINKNLNVNLNQNMNKNANLNNNLNTNLNSNLNTNTVASTIDSDNDSLTDEQEVLYGTDKNNPDTDGDGYKDGDEIVKSYSPNGSGRLNLNDFIKYCINDITTISDQPFTAQEITNVCNKGAELYDPMLKLAIAGDTAGLQAKADTLQNDIGAKCDILFQENGEKNFSCSFGLLGTIINFGKVK